MASRPPQGPKGALSGPEGILMDTEEPSLVLSNPHWPRSILYDRFICEPNLFKVTPGLRLVSPRP